MLPCLPLQAAQPAHHAGRGAHPQPLHALLPHHPRQHRKGAARGAAALLHVRLDEVCGVGDARRHRAGQHACRHLWGQAALPALGAQHRLHGGVEPDAQACRQGRGGAGGGSANGGARGAEPVASWGLGSWHLGQEAAWAAAHHAAASCLCSDASSQQPPSQTCSNWSHVCTAQSRCSSILAGKWQSWAKKQRAPACAMHAMWCATGCAMP